MKLNLRALICALTMVSAGVAATGLTTSALAAPAPPPAPTTAPAATTAAGGFVPLPAARILDTRGHLGSTSGRLAGGHTLTLAVSGRGRVPATNVGAVLLNVTALTPTSTGGVSVWPAGSARPSTTNLAFTAGVNQANAVVVPLGAGGAITLSDNSPGSVDLVADVTGYYVGGTLVNHGVTQILPPTRLADTRTGLHVRPGVLGAGRSLVLTPAGHNGVPADASGAFVNVTVLDATEPGGLNVYPAGSPYPNHATVSYLGGRTTTAMTIVGLGSNRQITFTNNSRGSIQLVVDTLGYERLATVPVPAGAFQALPSTRFLDTRTGIGAPARPLDLSGSIISVPMSGRGQLPRTGVSAVVMTITAVAPGSTGGLSVWPGTQPRTTLSAISFSPGAANANLVVVPLGTDGTLKFRDNSTGRVDVVADVIGYYRSVGKASNF